MSAEFIFRFDEPIICTAIHNGHQVSKLVEENLAISAEDRLREEDPFTEYFTKISNNRIIALKSRFEFDLNRSRDKAIYQKPEDAWGLVTRKREYTQEEKDIVLQGYDDFYRRVELNVQEMIDIYGKCFVWDIHSYNHHRLGSDQPFDSEELNPEIILGTSNLTEEWFPLVAEIQEVLLEQNYFGRKIDARINVKFPGGYFPRWLNNEFQGKVCCIALEFKKTFMDEWTSVFYPDVMKRLRELLMTTKGSITKYLLKV
ncbi:MAG: N-formylglutamate amidohydrolase [Candidatus Cloacimonas sp.]|nr:N-formylglutamate amidohydrolase [Candidatus Cloacimonadota bacterium]